MHSSNFCYRRPHYSDRIPKGSGNYTLTVKEFTSWIFYYFFWSCTTLCLEERQMVPYTFFDAQASGNAALTAEAVTVHFCHL